MDSSNKLTNDSPKDQIKLCGYLRKKRNKVGGWRKLWFVLQDRLLVSYKSKEDYNNKLVSFKDVLNLMPGTQIRPLDGLRFSIETTTQIIYTFHCDDQNAYLEWISKLLNCLKTNSVSISLPTNRFCHFSTHAHIKTRSFVDSIGAEPNVLSRKSNVEKMLEQNFHCLYEKSVKREAVMKHIERMDITGDNEYRKNEIYTDLKNEYRRSKMIAKQSSEMLTTFPSLAKEENDYEILNNLENKTISNDEPVYAVVDLKTKYLQRKKRLLETQGKRWNSYESIFSTVIEAKERVDQPTEGIYEDGDAYFLEQISQKDLHRSTTKIGEENIYDSINVAEHTTTLTLRKYLSRLTLKPFFYRKNNNKTKNNDFKTSSSVHFDGSTKSRFATIRSKFGLNRKSMQRRLRKLMNGNGFTPSPLFQYHNEETTTSSSSVKKMENSVCVENEGIYDNARDVIVVEKDGLFNNNNAKETAKTVDSLPHFKKAVQMFRNSPFKSTTILNYTSKDIKNSSDIIVEE